MAALNLSPPIAERVRWLLCPHISRKSHWGGQTIPRARGQVPTARGDAEGRGSAGLDPWGVPGSRVCHCASLWNRDLRSTTWCHRRFVHVSGERTQGSEQCPLTASGLAF